jgi:SHS2 domain-containing protein
MSYEFLDHTADVKVRALGKTIEEAFVAAAMALKESICGSMAVVPSVGREIVVEGGDLESLLCSFLEEFLFLLDAENFLLSAVRNIEIESGRLTAKVMGSKASDYEFSNSVKAVTYNEVSVREEAYGWIAEFVLDV